MQTIFSVNVTDSFISSLFMAGLKVGLGQLISAYLTKRAKTLGSRVALLPGKFVPSRKLFPPKNMPKKIPFQ